MQVELLDYMERGNPLTESRNNNCSKCVYVSGKFPTFICSLTKAYCIAERAIDHDNRPCGKSGKLFKELTNKDA